MALSDAEKEALAIIQGPDTADSGEAYGELTPEDLQQINEEQRLSKEFGNPVTAAALGAARGVSLGLSDFALQGAGVSADTLRNIEEQSPFASGGGEAVGVIAPLAVPGVGEVLLPAGALMKGAGLVGKAASKKVASKVAKKIISTTITGAVEGAGFGAGNLTSDVALGNQKLSAESLIANIGPGAAFGGGLGGLIGTGAAVAPKVMKVAAPFTRRIEKFAGKMVDPDIAIQELSGLSPKRLDKLGPQFTDDLLDYGRKHLVTAESTADDLVANNARTVKLAGKQIEDLGNKLDQELVSHPSVVEQANIGNRLAKVVQDTETQLIRDAEYIKGPQLRTLKKFQNQAMALAQDIQNAQAAGLRGTIPGHGAGGVFQRLNGLRKQLQDITWNPQGTKLDNFPAQIADQMRAELRHITDDIADGLAQRAGPEFIDAAYGLKNANKVYHVGKTIEQSLAARAAKREIKSLWEVAHIAATGGDIRRNLVVLSNIGKNVLKAKESIKESVGNFFKKISKGAISLSNKGLASSGFAVDKERKEPKNETEAFNNIRSNVRQLAENTGQFQNKLVKTVAPLMNISPDMGIAAQQRLVTAVDFLNSKLPKSSHEGTAQFLFNKEYTPTTMERAKFQRYLQIVEQPFTVLAEIEQGTLTREHVEALQSVYPEIYKEVQDQVMEQINEHPDTPYQKRLTLGILLNIPSDQSLDPSAVLGLQKNFQTVAEAEQNPNVQAAQAADMSEMDIASREASGVEQIQQRGS